MVVVESEHKAVALGLIILMSTVAIQPATPVVLNHNPETKFITITSLPSATNTGLDYVWTINSWINYCPNCGKYDTLTVNPKGVYEQEITCSACDSDYCGSSGKEKGHIKSFLIRYEPFKLETMGIKSV